MAYLQTARRWVSSLWMTLVIALGACVFDPRVDLAQEAPAPAPVGPFRKLAPGVETVIASQVSPEETFSLQTVLGQPDIRVRRNTQCLEFAFKPLRFIQTQGVNERGQAYSKLVWYMVYHVKLPQSIDAEGNPLETKPMRFFPTFELVDEQSKRVYPERIIAPAIAAIRHREDPNRPLLNTAEMAGDIQPSSPGEDHSVWGVATWDNIDLNINRFSISIGGLSNAVRVDENGVEQFKYLKLNFWRPGDAYNVHEREIRFGAPGQLDYQWIYR